MRDRLQKGRAIPEEHIQADTDKNGVFKVKSQSRADLVHIVSFGDEFSSKMSPSCTYEDSEKTHRLCQHFTGVFAHFHDWGWHALSDNYKSNIYFNLDEVATVSSSLLAEATGLDNFTAAWMEAEAEDQPDEHGDGVSENVKSVARACREKLSAKGYDLPIA